MYAYMNWRIMSTDISRSRIHSTKATWHFYGKSRHVDDEERAAKMMKFEPSLLCCWGSEKLQRDWLFILQFTTCIQGESRMSSIDVIIIRFFLFNEKKSRGQFSTHISIPLNYFLLYVRCVFLLFCLTSCRE